MPDGERSAAAADDSKPAPQPVVEPMFSAYGVASAALGVLAVAAIVIGAVIFASHRGQVAERVHQATALQAAAEWTGVLINMDTDNIDASLQRLHEQTVGRLNDEFDSTVQPYRRVVEKVQSHSTGQIEAVAIESVRHDDDDGTAPGPSAEQLPTEIASRTDTVVVVATSDAENAGGRPQTVHWNLRLDVADVDGTPKISGLESIR